MLDRRQPDLTVLMERVNKSHNLSAILRNCDAVGVLEAHAVLPDRQVEVHQQTSAGSAKWIPVHVHETLGEASATLRSTGFRIVAAHPADEAVDYRSVDFTRPTAILLGAELDGLSPEALSLADEVAAIPMVGMVHSLNVSVAASLLLFEAFRQRLDAGFYEEPRLDPGRYAELLFEWGYPRIAARCRAHGLPYPRLGEHGRILDPLPFNR